MWSVWSSTGSEYSDHRGHDKKTIFWKFPTKRDCKRSWTSFWIHSGRDQMHVPKPFLLVRFPALALGHLEPPGQHSGGRSVDVGPLFLLGHSIRRWAPSASCRSTSKATWPRSTGTTGRDMPGSCGWGGCALRPALIIFFFGGGGEVSSMFTPAFPFASTLQEEVGVAPPEPAAVLRRDLPKGDGVHVLGVQTLRPPGGHRHAGGGRVRAGGAGEIAVQSSVVAEALAFAVTSRLVGCFRPQVKMQDKDVTFALKVIKKKHVVDNRQEEHIHSERKILAEARSPFVVKSVPSTGPQTGFHVLF